MSLSAFRLTSLEVPSYDNLLLQIYFLLNESKKSPASYPSAPGGSIKGAHPWSRRARPVKYAPGLHAVSVLPYFSSRGLCVIAGLVATQTGRISTPRDDLPDPVKTEPVVRTSLIPGLSFGRHKLVKNPNEWTVSRRSRRVRKSPLPQKAFPNRSA